MTTRRSVEGLIDRVMYCRDHVLCAISDMRNFDRPIAEARYDTRNKETRAARLGEMPTIEKKR